MADSSRCGAPWFSSVSKHILIERSDRVAQQKLGGKWGRKREEKHSGEQKCKEKGGNKPSTLQRRRVSLKQREALSLVGSILILSPHPSKNSDVGNLNK